MADLERIATALFVVKDSGVAPKDRVQRLMNLKPHVKLPEAALAFQRLEEIRAVSSNILVELVHRLRANSEQKRLNWQLFPEPYRSDGNLAGRIDTICLPAPTPAISRRRHPWQSALPLLCDQLWLGIVRTKQPSTCRHIARNDFQVSRIPGRLQGCEGSLCAFVRPSGPPSE